MWGGTWWGGCSVSDLNQLKNRGIIEKVRQKETDLLKAPCQGFSSSYGAGAVEVELWGGEQGGGTTRLILASGQSAWSHQARHGRPF